MIKENILKLFPTLKKKFTFNESSIDTLNRLKRTTKKSNLVSVHTDKAFIGNVNLEIAEFRLITSEIGKGAFCVMSGKINKNYGEVEVKINNPFKILLSIFYIFPFINIIYFYFQDIPFIFSFIIQSIVILIVLRLIIELSFKILAKSSLKILKNKLDLEWEI